MRAFNPSQLVRNNSDDIKLSLKMFLQGLKWHHYSIRFFERAFLVRQKFLVTNRHFSCSDKYLFGFYIHKHPHLSRYILKCMHDMYINP